MSTSTSTRVRRRGEDCYGAPDLPCTADAPASGRRASRQPEQDDAMPRTTTAAHAVALGVISPLLGLADVRHASGAWPLPMLYPLVAALAVEAGIPSPAFALGAGTPLGMVVMWMARHAAPLCPGAVSTLGGLSAAAFAHVGPGVVDAPDAAAVALVRHGAVRRGDDAAGASPWPRLHAADVLRAPRGSGRSALGTDVGCPGRRAPRRGGPLRRRRPGCHADGRRGLGPGFASLDMIRSR
jgi:hypothetical protein